MAEYVHLIGAEEVMLASHAMAAAAEEMKRAAANIEDTMFRHRQFLEDWALRFQDRLDETLKEKK